MVGAVEASTGGREASAGNGSSGQSGAHGGLSEHLRSVNVGTALEV